MLSVRIIPCLDVRDGRVVKGVNFVNLVDAGDPVEQAKAYENQGADELVFLDITASSDNRAIMQGFSEHFRNNESEPRIGGFREIWEPVHSSCNRREARRRGKVECLYARRKK